MSPSRSICRERLSRTAHGIFVRRIRPVRTGGLALILILGCPRLATATQGCTTQWISTPGGGVPAFGDSLNSALSTDGRFVAFDSIASNLVPGDGNAASDAFVLDRQLNTIERVSVGTGGIEGNGGSGGPDISGDGRFVVFVSASTNLDPGDTHPAWDIYLRDRVTQTTQLISAHLSPPVKPNWGGAEPRISPDGRFVAFSFGEDIIVPGDTNGWGDVFLRDMSTGLTELISVSSSGVQSNEQSATPAMSADGRYVAFRSRASNWFPGNLPQPWSKDYVYVRDRQLGTLIPVNLNSIGKLGPGNAGNQLDLSADGRFLVYMYGFGGSVDLPSIWLSWFFVRDLFTGVTQPVDSSVFGNNAPPNPFLLSPSNPTISADGRFVVFESFDDQLVLHTGNTGGINVFIHDRLTGLTQGAGLGPNGQWPSLPPQTGAEAFFPSISPDGRSVSFSCEDPTFGSGNAFYNIYVRTCDWTQPQVYCDSQVSSLGCRPTVTFAGSPSVTTGSGFTVEVQGLVSSSSGFLFYSTGRPFLTPFQGNYLCMEPPIRRMPPQPTSGSQAPDCTGGLSVDFNAWIASGADPTLIAGENACVQAWTHDRGAATGANLSNALAFAIGP